VPPDENSADRQPTHSIVIPAYNESARIVTTLEKVFAFLATQSWSAEIIVVNDGSRDDTVEIVRKFQRIHPELQLVENPGNRGKGFSVRNGMLNARGELLLFTDADLSSPIDECHKLFQAIAEGADVAMGSRWVRAELQTRRQPFYRQLFGRIFNLALRLVLGLNFKDTQCGFKAFTQRAATTIFPQQKIERWGFDAELLFLAKRSGFRVAEVPVKWAHSAGTRLSPLRDGIRMFGETIKIRWNAVAGKYASPSKQPTSPLA
jgi:glycosyltransferase involved in cell wall biosynthesis